MKRIQKIIVIVLVIIAVIICVLAIIISRKVTILNDLSNKVATLEDTNTNIHIKSTCTTMISSIEGNISNTEIFIKDNIYKAINEQRNADKSVVNLIQITYPEERKVFIDKAGNKELTIYKEIAPVRKSLKAELPEGVTSSYSVLTGVRPEDYGMKQRLFLSIEEFNLGGKDCYKIEDKIGNSLVTNEDENAITRQVLWIEKNTGLLVQSISYHTINGVEKESKIVTKETEFDTVTDEDLVEPDISQYKIQEN